MSCWQSPDTEVSKLRSSLENSTRLSLSKLVFSHSSSSSEMKENSESRLSVNSEIKKMQYHRSLEICRSIRRCGQVWEVFRTWVLSFNQLLDTCRHFICSYSLPHETSSIVSALYWNQHAFNNNWVSLSSGAYFCCKWVPVFFEIHVDCQSKVRPNYTERKTNLSVLMKNKQISGYNIKVLQLFSTLQVE